MSDPTQARERWYEAHEGLRYDRPRVSVWWPEQMPSARLQTVTVDTADGRRDVLQGPPMVTLQIGGVDIGGRLEDIELLLACAVEAVAEQRVYADRLQSEPSDA